MNKLRTFVKDWRSLSSTHKLAWLLVGWEGGRAVIFSAPLNGGVLTIAALLLSTDRYHRHRTKRSASRRKGGGPGSTR